MSSQTCPKCGEKKILFTACGNCGFKKRNNYGEKGKAVFEFSELNRHKKKLFNKKTDEKLTQEQVRERDRIKRLGFSEGAKVPGSHIRKIDK
jgi:hypothetical protein